jgi:phytoene synthase
MSASAAATAVAPPSSIRGRSRGHVSEPRVASCARRGVRTRATASTSAPDADVLDRAFAFAETYTKESSATFYFATRLMPPEQRRKVWAIYAWCRALDETVDGVEARDAGSARAATELDAIEARLLDVFQIQQECIGERGDFTSRATASTSDPVAVALAETVRTTEGMSATPFLDMIAGMRDDLRDDVSFADWPSLREYCYRVAGTVGLMTLPVLGVADGYSVEDATDAGVDLGIALQLCNIVRDVGEDARRGRVYLPLAILKKHNLSVDDVLNADANFAVNNSNYAAATEEMILIAETHFESAKCGTKMLAPAQRLPVLAAAEMYGALLTKVREARYDNVSKRAYTTTTEKLFVLPRVAREAWFGS